MKYFYDTEFLENGETIELISIGIVAEDGREYYAVNTNMSASAIVNHEWLRENVWPYLPLRSYALSHGMHTVLDTGHKDVKYKSTIAKEVMEFLQPNPEDYRHTELWAWCGAYDHVALMQLWGTMSSVHGTGLPFYTHDLKSIHDLFLTDEQRDELRNLEFDGNAHNALDDARQLQQRYDYVNGIIGLPSFSTPDDKQ